MEVKTNCAWWRCDKLVKWTSAGIFSKEAWAVYMRNLGDELNSLHQIRVCLFIHKSELLRVCFEVRHLVDVFVVCFIAQVILVHVSV